MKGFTLIELLAVIIILAIVALIATPIVLDVVDNSKYSAAKSEAHLIVSGINNFCEASKMKAQMDKEYTDICADGVTNAEVKSMVKLGSATINGDPTYNGKITDIKIVSNGYNVVMSGGKWSNPTK